MKNDRIPEDLRARAAAARSQARGSEGDPNAPLRSWDRGEEAWSDRLTQAYRDGKAAGQVEERSRAAQESAEADHDPALIDAALESLESLIERKVVYVNDLVKAGAKDVLTGDMGAAGLGFVFLSTASVAAAARYAGLPWPVAVIVSGWAWVAYVVWDRRSRIRHIAKLVAWAKAETKNDLTGNPLEDT